MDSLDGLGVLVVGASSGLGAATVRHLSQLGARVVVADVQDQAGRALAESVDGRFVHTDVLDEDSVAQAVATAAEVPRGLQILVVCAGVTKPTRLVGGSGAAAPLDSFLAEISVNLVGSINVLRLAAAAMAQNEPDEDGVRGLCVLTASIAAFDGQRGNVGYAASKAGVAGLTLPASRDLADLGIRVVTIAPGVFDTPMVAGLPAGARASIAAQEQLPRRVGRPEEFAALIGHVATNAMINGVVIRIDGGVRLPAR